MINRKIGAKKILLFALDDGFNKYSKEDNGLVLNVKNNALALSNDSSILDGKVKINVFKKQNLTTKDYQGGASC